MNKMIKYCLVLLASTLFCSCNSDAVKQIDREQVTIYYNKINSLSKESLPYSDANRVRNFESYKDIYNWIKNDVKNFPLLFQYVIYDEMYPI